MYRVLNWDRHFEGAKSKTYNNKTSCSLPTKHGLGYRRLISEKDGVALFGAWVALIQVLSRHNKPRQGYCTDTGRSDGTPYTPNDLEMLTGISAKYFDRMLKVCKSHNVGWVSLTKTKDTTGDCQGTLLPLNSDLDSNLNSDLDSNSDYSSHDEVEFIKRFNKVTGKSHRKLVEKARKQFKARLKDGYTLDEIITAAKNAANDDHHKNSGCKHLTPELITRDTRLDAWLNIKEHAGSDNFQPPTIQEARDYVKEYADKKNLIIDIKYQGMTAERFVSHYGATGWKMKGDQMTEWKGKLGSFIMSDYEAGKIARRS